jgi:hypothetical protein
VSLEVSKRVLENAIEQALLRGAPSSPGTTKLSPDSAQRYIVTRFPNLGALAVSGT